MSHTNRINRRGFLKRAGVGAVGLGLAPGTSGRAAGADGPVERRKLGRTGIEIGVVSFGSYGFDNPGILEMALDAGMNLIDTGYDYQQGRAESAVGRVMKARREDAVLLTKWIVKPEKKAKDYLNELDGSLKRLQTDHVEFIQNYDVGNVEAVKNEAFFEAAQQAKTMGKVRHTGISCHGGPLENVMSRAVADGRYDMLMFKYNFTDYPSSEATIKQAREKNLGLVAIKVGGSARNTEMRQLLEQGLDKRQATIRWALQNPAVAAVCCDFSNFDDIKTYRKAVASAYGEKDRLALQVYSDNLANQDCRLCGTCRPVCPQGVRIDDVMRYRMYYRDYGREQYAMWRYSELPSESRPLNCAECGAPCVDACPNGVAVREDMMDASALLT
ncbi:aldo/keto reductase [candidate division KSB1 bacterium]